MLGKHCLDAGWGQFFTILEQTCLKHGVYFQKVSAHKTSQTCLNCLTETGKKELSMNRYANQSADSKGNSSREKAEYHLTSS
ncbi:MAG: zinc ribbon domain-containing protein [Microcoleus sp.]